MAPKLGKRFVFKALRNASDSVEMNVNGSVTAVDFTYTAPESVEVQRLLIYVVDVGMGHAEFGGLGAALTNGLEIKLFDAADAEILDFTDGLNIKDNDDWTILAGSDVELANSAQEDLQPIRWTISKAGYPLLMEQGHYIQIKVQDDLSDLTKFRAFIQGTLS